MKRPMPAIPEWFSLMMSDALTDYDSEVDFQTIVEKAWRRVCRGRTFSRVVSVDMETGEVDFQPSISIRPPYTKGWPSP